nr:EAL domain-containing protein [Marinobacter gelidimuriae]
MFRLKYYFSIVSLIAIVTSAAILSSYYYRTTVEQLTELEERNYLALTHTIANILWPQYSDFLKNAESLSRSELVKHPLSKSLHNDLAQMVQGLVILKIKIFDTKGKVLFSTNLTQTGTIKPIDYPGSQVALTGNAISNMSDRDKFIRIDGSEVTNRTVLSSYLPIKKGSENEIVGVIEIYSDVTQSMSSIESKLFRFISIILLILGILYWVLYLFVAKADKMLVLANEEKDKRADELILAASVFSNAREGITITDVAGNIIEANDSFTDITGYSREEVIGQNPRIFQSGRQSPEFYVSMWQTINTKGYWRGEIWNRRKDGEDYPEILTISAVKDAAGEVTHYVALFNDISQQKDHQAQLERMAHYDVLTKLPNRALLADRLNQAILQSNRNHNSLAVAFLDLDGFKAVNDTHGHAVGDELLIIVSQRMKEALREVDSLARFGGDEFVAVLTDLAKTEDCQAVLDRFLLAVSEPITVGDVVLKVSASIGVALYPQDGEDESILIRHADQSMYVAKQEGKNCYHFFDAAQDEAIYIQRENLGDISAALDRREFVLHYQPKVNMSTGEVVGVEALIRWQHPVRGLVPPLDFLPVIEGHAISLDIGEWVIDTALSQISQWQSMGLTLPISVNISAYQLQQTDFVERLAALLAAHPDVSPHNLELEILETSALSDVSQVAATMRACIDLGVHFALDDFGTGYSSLTYLRRLPARLIKIDQSFIQDMLTDSDDLAIVAGVISLAKTFQREMIAEGVETIEHGTALLQLGCELAQGYGIARPMPAGDVPAWVGEWKPDVSWLI